MPTPWFQDGKRYYREVIKCKSVVMETYTQIIQMSSSIITWISKERREYQGAKGNVTTDTEIREGDWTMLLCCLKNRTKNHKKEMQEAETLGWKRQQADPLQNFQKKKHSHADLWFWPYIWNSFSDWWPPELTVRNWVALRH